MGEVKDIKPSNQVISNVKPSNEAVVGVDQVYYDVGYKDGLSMGLLLALTQGLFGTYLRD